MFYCYLMALRQQNSIEIVMKSPCDAIYYKGHVEFLISELGTGSVVFESETRLTLNHNFVSFSHY